jgi:fused signal recognition particle receptor
MSGFFKKLFNRITGKKEEETQDVAVEQTALPAPLPEPELIIERAEEPVFEKPKAAKPAPKKPQAKPPAAKKPEPKKLVAKKAVTAKAPPAKAKPVVKATSKPAAKPEPVKAKVKPAPAPPPAKAKPVAKPEGKKAKPAKPVAVPKPAAAAPLPPPPPVLPPAAIPVAPPPPPPPEPVVVEIPSETAAQRKGWFSRLTDGLSKSSKSITGSITAIFTKRKLDKETLQELEDTLIQADLGLAVSERIIAEVSRGRFDKEIDPEEVKQILASEVAKVLKPVEVPFNFGSEKPYVILVVGVNGSGKTTTIGKLGSIAAGEGFKVKFAACDTFRAAAIEQLTVWGKRIGADTISRPQGADAAGLAFDAMKAAGEDGTDILFIDTAGRLHNKTYLMDELDKVVRVIKKYDAQAPHAVLLVLDATTGQNALAQAEAFTKVAGVTGIIMTKLDGTARGGILVAIAEKFKLPIHAIGVGESIEDLQAFDANAFARAIAGLEDKP